MSLMSRVHCVYGVRACAWCHAESEFQHACTDACLSVHACISVVCTHNSIIIGIL